MLRELSGRPRRVLMTIDAVGGVWRYAIDLAAGLRRHGVETLLVGLGPGPDAGQRAEAEAVARLIWLDLPLDWLAASRHALEPVPSAIAALATGQDVDLVHLNLPTQAAGVELDRPVVVVSHSCVATWFRAVRGSELPADWRWQGEINAEGLRRADAVLVPSRSHGAALEACYGPLPQLVVVPNAAAPEAGELTKDQIVVAAGRWWDEGKNGASLDAAARDAIWPVLMAGTTVGPNGEAFSIRHAGAPGQLASAALRTLLGRAAIVASPSVYEPFGLVALEAASAGAALVLADIPTYRELWSDAAVFVEPRDATAWSEAINDLTGDTPKREALGRLAAERARRFSAEAQLDAVLAAYAAAAARPARARMVA